MALANAMPVRQAVWLQRKGAYRSAAAQAFIAVLQEQGVTPTPPSAASSQQMHQPEAGQISELTTIKRWLRPVSRRAKGPATPRSR